ncbi:helix-turn-helix domain-containing protein [Nocardioides sp.]|uniref:sigma-54-dependent Fis family transcriptional regulator n=1 Tax=Nocardioides sp. TaxID=35761 RepID=UPI00286E4D70|nr:helix-turn-helix domain-containing protein [Nocardioides sp.]
MATSREQFLTRETPAPQGVRGPILASWRRSHEWHVAADRIEMSYEPDVHLDTRLSRSALPVLKTLREQLDGQSVSVILTDPTGLVLTRMTGDSDLERHLDRVLLAPGFNYAEKFVGTNGIGTALEVGGPAHVFGHEHYAENLEDLACAAVPIHHPISSRLVGAVDLTCWRRDAGALLLTLAKATAEQIRQSLLVDAASNELRLVQEYLRTCRRNPGIVLALNNDVAMLNEFARTILEPGDQAALFAHAAEAMTSGRHSSAPVELPSGQRARLHCRALEPDDLSAGIVAHVTIESRRASGPRVPQQRPAPLPGLVGSGPVWLNACRDVERAFGAGEWLVVEGESGVGKLAVLTAVQLRRQPIGRFLVLDAAEAAGDRDWQTNTRHLIDEHADSVVIRHVDTLDATGLRALHSTLHAARGNARDKPLWAAVTLARSDHASELTQLLQLFPSTVEVPPLRMHREDLQPLVALFLSRLSQGGHLVCSPEAMRLFMRMELPGNGEQVRQILREVVRHRRTGRIEPEDLPPQAHTMSRRVLTPLEAMERDAIVTSLSDANGNKAHAARALGMSRATIYRKIHDYGIVTPT